MDWKEIAASIVETVKDQAKDLWNQNAEARTFVEERAERLAKLTVEYATATGDEKAAKKEQMDLVFETIETELLAIALIGQAAAKSTFMAVVNSVFSAVVKVLPVVLGAL